MYPRPSRKQNLHAHMVHGRLSAPPAAASTPTPPPTHLHHCCVAPRRVRTRLAVPQYLVELPAESLVAVAAGAVAPSKRVPHQAEQLVHIHQRQGLLVHCHKHQAQALQDNSTAQGAGESGSSTHTGSSTHRVQHTQGQAHTGSSTQGPAQGAHMWELGCDVRRCAGVQGLQRSDR